MGLVIKFEGIDGSGKTSLISRIAKDLRSEFKILVTKEFGSPHDIIRYRYETGTDPVEANDFDYFERVRDSYYHFFSNIENVFFVDGSLSKSKIDEIVKQEILNRIPPVTSS